MNSLSPLGGYGGRAETEAQFANLFDCFLNNIITKNLKLSLVGWSVDLVS